MEIENAIQAEQEKLRKIELAKSEIQGGKGELHYNISIKPIPGYQVCYPQLVGTIQLSGGRRVFSCQIG